MKTIDYRSAQQTPMAEIDSRKMMTLVIVMAAMMIVVMVMMMMMMMMMMSNHHHYQNENEYYNHCHSCHHIHDRILNIDFGNYEDAVGLERTHNYPHCCW